MNITPKELLEFANLAAAQAKRNYKKQLQNKPATCEVAELILLIKVFSKLKNAVTIEDESFMEDVSMAEDTMMRLIDNEYQYEA